MWLAYLGWRVLVTTGGAHPVLAVVELGAEVVLAAAFAVHHVPLLLTAAPDRPSEPPARLRYEGNAVDVVIVADGGSELELRAAVLAASHVEGVDRIVVLDPRPDPGRQSATTSLGAGYLSGAPIDDLVRRAQALTGRSLVVLQRSRHVLAPWVAAEADRVLRDRPDHVGVILEPLGDPDEVRSTTSRRRALLAGAGAALWEDGPAVLRREAWLAAEPSRTARSLLVDLGIAVRRGGGPMASSGRPSWRSIDTTGWADPQVTTTVVARAARAALSRRRAGRFPFAVRSTLWDHALGSSAAISRLLLLAVAAVTAVTGRVPLVAPGRELLVAAVAVIGTTGLTSRVAAGPGCGLAPRWRHQARRLGAHLAPQLHPRRTVAAVAIATRQAQVLLVVVALSAVAVAGLHTPLHVARPPDGVAHAILVLAGIHLALAHDAQRFLRRARTGSPLLVGRGGEANVALPPWVSAVSPHGVLTDASAPTVADVMAMTWRGADGTVRTREVGVRWAETTDADGACWLLFDEPAVEVRDALLSYVSVGHAFEAASGVEVLPSPIGIEVASA